MTIIDGKKIAADVISLLKFEVLSLPFQPIFCDVLVGNNSVSRQYVDLKAKKAESIGIKFLHAEFESNITTEKLVSEIKNLNSVENMCGLIVQLPLPKEIDSKVVLNAIDPEIDVDCLGKVRSEKFYNGDIEIAPPTSAAILQILDTLKIDLSTKNILVVGQGELVGRPTAFLLKKRGLQFNVINSSTKNSNELLLSADLIISGVGKSKLITSQNIKSGAIIIDAGASEDSGAIVGDVDFESVKQVASAISPVPGGVGPVTVAMLLKNVVKVAKFKSKN